MRKQFGQSDLSPRGEEIASASAKLSPPGRRWPRSGRMRGLFHTAAVGRVRWLWLCLRAALRRAHELPGAAMSLWWGLPFAGLLLSIATGPLLFHHVWEHHYGKIAAVWAALVVVPLASPSACLRLPRRCCTRCSPNTCRSSSCLFALFTISGGILVAGNIHGTPLVNAGLLLVGAMLASVIGTTGASMILIRPMHPRQRQPAVQRPCRHLLHFPGVQHRRLADAARRPAAVRRLPARRRLLLDDRESLARDAVRRRRGAARLPGHRHRAASPRRRRAEDQGPDAGYEGAHSRPAPTCRCWPASSARSCCRRPGSRA